MHTKAVIMIAAPPELQRPPIPESPNSEEKLAKLKQDIKIHYPFVTFETERAKRRPDQETQDLYHRLVGIGHMKPSDSEAKKDLETIKKKWEEDTKEKAKRDGRLTFDGMDFSSLDLSDMDLSGISFGIANFENANLSNVNFKNSVFMLTNLKGAVLDHANLEGGLFISANLTNSSLRNTDMRGNFVYSDFKGAMLEDVQIDPKGFFKVRDFPFSVEYPKDDVKGWLDEELKRQTAKTPNQEKQDQNLLSQVDELLEMYRQRLMAPREETDPEDQALIDELVTLGRAHPTTEEEKRMLIRKKYEWSLRKNERGRLLVLDGLDLSNMDLSTMDLTNLSLIGANCAGTDFTWSVLSGINCSLANFMGAKLRMDTLRGAIPFGTDFTNADLSAARAKDTAFINAKFRGAKIEYTDLKRCLLLGTDFTGATIEEAGFNGSTPLENLTVATFV